MLRLKNPNPSRLPSEYQEVEYIESTGTQYINTGITENSLYGMNFAFEINKVAVSYQSLVAGTLDVFTLGSKGTSITGIYLRIKSAEIVNRDNLLPSGKNVLSVKNGVVSLNDTQIATYTNGAFSSSSKSVYIFTNRSLSRKSSMRVYNLELFNSSGNAVRNFVPCYRKSDNVAGLYDLVNSKFYTNENVGTFLVGADVSKKDLNYEPMFGSKKIVREYIGDKLVYGKPPVNDEQLVNYTMIYDLGDECTDITGGWIGGRYIDDYGNATGTYTKNDTSLYCKADSLTSCGFFTNNKIDLTEYAQVYFKIITYYKGYGVSAVINPNKRLNNEGTGQVLSVGLNKVSLTTKTEAYVGFGCWAYGSTIAVDRVFIVKEDDWQMLAEIMGITASSIDEILANSEILLSNKDAVEFMIHKCTGSFMMSAIQSETFLTALNSSPYNTTIQANEHWNKFLAMVA